MTEQTDKNLSFSETLKNLSLEQLREKEGFLLDLVLQHYDNLENKSNTAKLNSLIESSLDKDTVKLNAVRFAIDLKVKTDLVNTGAALYTSLFGKDDLCGYCDSEGLHLETCPRYHSTKE
jgi:hypothetical protein